VPACGAAAGIRSTGTAATPGSATCTSAPRAPTRAACRCRRCGTAIERRCGAADERAKVTTGTHALADTEALAGRFAQMFGVLGGNIERVIRGKRDKIDLALVCLLS